MGGPASNSHPPTCLQAHDSPPRAHAPGAPVAPTLSGDSTYTAGHAYDSRSQPALAAPPRLAADTGLTAVWQSPAARPNAATGGSSLLNLADHAVPVFHVRSPSVPVASTLNSPPSSATGLRETHKPATTTPSTAPPEDPGLSQERDLHTLLHTHAPPLKPPLSSMSVNSQSSLSPASGLSSPALAAMSDITPLPSPLLNDDSPGSLKRYQAQRPGSSGSLSSLRENVQESEFAPSSQTASSSRASSIKKKSGLSTLASGTSGTHAAARRPEASHSRNRSSSDFVPETAHVVRPRNATLPSSSQAGVSGGGIGAPLHREEYLAELRGLVPQSHHHDQGPAISQTNASAAFPTPPSSNRSVTESEGDESSRNDVFREFYVVSSGKSGQTTSYRPVRLLGQGTFSKVILATSELFESKGALGETPEANLDAKKLVAIKIVELGPAGGADAERMQLSLKREIELMQSISHPSLIHLESFDTSGEEAFLVLNYCAGGDLFDLACQHRDILNPQMVQRIFAELVGAVRYLHEKWIVHRDIKLENVLVNIPFQSLSKMVNPQTYPAPLVTVTDLGLSRELPQPPNPPFLTTRCGSEDYAAPEIMLSQPYDGRLTDAWALGVLLYSLMEGRLPFDPPPYKPGAKVSRGRTKAAFRIARCDWIWSRFGDVNGNWDASLGQGWEGARDVVDGLLRKVSRGRWDLPKVQANEWVSTGIQVTGGLRRRNE